MNCRGLAVVLAAMMLVGCAASSTVSDGEDVVTDVVSRISDAYVDVIRGEILTSGVQHSDGTCTDDEERVGQQTRTPVGVSVAEARAMWDEWVADNADVDVRDEGGTPGDTLVAYDDDNSYRQTDTVARDDYTVTLTIAIVTDGREGATVVVDAYSDCLPLAA